MSGRKKITKEKTKKIDVRDISHKLCDWMFGDHGPLGWNDPAHFQDALKEMSETDGLIFINSFISELELRLTQII